MSTQKDDGTLSGDLSTASRSRHKKSNNILHARLIVLFTDRQLYGKAIGCFYHVFEALEVALVKCSEHKDVKKLWPTLSGGMFRAPGFAKDVEYFLGPSWKEQIAPGPAVLNYVQHLKQLADNNPTLLLAHSYTQHLAMASGGQAIKRMARKQLSLPEDQGTAAFNFIQGSTAGALKNAFVAAFNALELTPEVKEQMIAEHLKAFEFNNDIITEFRLGWGPFFLGLVRLVPPVTRVSLVLVVGALLLATYIKTKPS